MGEASKRNWATPVPLNPAGTVKVTVTRVHVNNEKRGREKGNREWGDRKRRRERREMREARGRGKRIEGQDREEGEARRETREERKGLLRDAVIQKSRSNI